MNHSLKVILENPGIDPGTSHMLSERSTTSANSPSLRLLDMSWVFAVRPVRGTERSLRLWEVRGRYTDYSDYFLYIYLFSTSTL